MLRTDLIRPVPDILRDNAIRFGDKAAFTDLRRSVGYAELEQRTRRLAGNLGCRRGDRVVLMLGNSVEMAEGYLGVARAAAIGVPVNPYCSDAELDHILLDSGANVLMAQASSVARRRELLARHPDLRLVVAGDPGGTERAFEELATTEPAIAARDDLGVDDVGWILYTSGTTGQPKGVVTTLTKALWGTVAGYVPGFGMSADDRLLWPMPLSHCLGHHLGVLGVAAVGAGTLLIDGFAAGPLLAALGGMRPTVLVGVPTLFQQLVRVDAEAIPTHTLRACWFGGAPGSGELGRAVEATLGVPLLNTYGASEATGAITVNPPSDRNTPASAGPPILGVNTRIVDPGTGFDVPAGAEGELWVAGPGVMVGYYNRPDLTAEVLRGEWLRTGDLARRDALGFLDITGRIKELIIRGGENIHPVEIENVVKRVAGVQDAAVCGKPHDTLGEVPIALVVPDPGGFEVAALFAECRKSLEHSKVPFEVYEIDAVPRTMSGKILRRELPVLASRLLGSIEAESAGQAGEWAQPDAAIRAELAARLATLSPADGVALLCDRIFESVASIIGDTHREVDGTFTDWGITSVGAVGLRNHLVTGTGLDITATAVFDYPTPEILAGHLRSWLLGEYQPAPLPTAQPAEDFARRIAEIESMDPAELVRLASVGAQAVPEAGDDGESDGEQ
ncbi:AMP-binding protein [Nocardia colli]|uniref:AMP-binding protein n=1 Tax=Nocardia colli TaxID=2545717 RepID=A0A5N0E9K6_9NOCA|nr:AMP-binding protein [Nocardia colli]